MISLEGTRGLVRSYKDHPQSCRQQARGHSDGSPEGLFLSREACTLGPSVALTAYGMMGTALPHVHPRAHAHLFSQPGKYLDRCLPTGRRWSPGYGWAGPLSSGVPGRALLPADPARWALACGFLCTQAANCPTITVKVSETSSCSRVGWMHHANKSVFFRATFHIFFPWTPK